MATIPGGLFDTSTISATLAGGLTSSLTSLLGSDTANLLVGGGTSTVIGGNPVTVSGGTGLMLETLQTVIGGGSASLSTIAGGGTLITGSGSASIVGGSGSDTLVAGTSTNVLFGSPSASVTATIENGSVVLHVSLPANISTSVQGLADPVQATTAQSYMHGQVDAVLPASNTSPAAQTLRAQLLTYIDYYTNAANSAHLPVVVKIINFADTSGSNAPRAASDITFTAENSSSTTDVFTFLMSDIQAGKSLVINNVEKAIATGSGKITVGDNTSTDIRGDHMNQEITGGSGNDTLVGGGGNDTLVGGGGSDTFGFNGLGNYVLTDFNVATDKLAFDVSGIHSLADLAPLVTKLEARGNDTYVEFAHGAASITLVGVSPAQITSEMIKFTI